MFTHIDHGIELPKLTRETTESGRKYFTPEGNVYPSITTVLSIMNQKSIQEWRNKVGEEAANRISTQAAVRGTAVHKLAEDYINNEERWTEGHMPANIDTFNSIKPIIDEKINNIWFQEEYLYSDEMRTAGQFDVIAEWEGKLSVIDFKTRRKPKTKQDNTHHFIQGCFYAKAFEEHTGVSIDQVVILIAVDNHEPLIYAVNPNDYIDHFWVVRESFEEFKNNGVS